MLNNQLNLNTEIFIPNPEKKSGRDSFGEALLSLGENNPNIVVLGADLMESTRINYFADKFPKRAIQMGIAEQNMIGVAVGLSLEKKIPFAVSHAVFNPSNNWAQIRMGVALSNANVKIVGTHSGFSNGKDGGVAEPFEDISLMRVLPNFTVIEPIDGVQVLKAAKMSASSYGPFYIRISKESTPLITTEDTPFEYGKALVLKEGKDITIVSSGPITYEALLASRELKLKYNIEAEVIASPFIKPLDKETIISSIRKTGKVISLEEHQIEGGLGGALAEVIVEEYPVRMMRLGIKGVFGESGSYEELKDKYGLSGHNIVNKVVTFLKL